MTSEESSQPTSDRLTLLYRLSQTFNSSLDLDEVLKRVMDEVIAVTGAERGFVALLEADGTPADTAFRLLSPWLRTGTSLVQHSSTWRLNGRRTLG